MLVDIPYKIGNAIFFNVVLYFLTNLRREPGAFFFFLLISFFTTLVMSMFFRFIGSVSRSLAQAMAPAAIFILAIIVFTGFVIPTRYMLGWCRWINYIDPVAYSFESLMINEFHNRQFHCSTFIPFGSGYEGIGGVNRVCSAVGSVVGQSSVNGDAYINSAYQYYHAHKWRNLGIIIAFVIGFCVFYIVAAETVHEKRSKGEVLVFRRGHIPASILASTADDEEAASERRGSVLKQVATQEEVSAMIQRQTSIFSWRNVCYDIKIKGEPRRILDHVYGWVKPGTLTALMGVSGAGKTTLLDALATRTTMGVISGEMLVDGLQRDQSFQRKTGYVQQQDLHLQTSTVREALNFSALLRQPRHVSRTDKLAYVEEVIKLLDMEEYADAIVGVPGEGLNVEQRKRLTIGVELAAKPQLLLFLDEPTSGLDSQTSWAICDLMEKLTNSGQAVLCTIHQPSAMLFQRFQRLLFLQKGGQTVYFGEIGQNAGTLIKYFERNGGFACPKDANPAEWMLEVIGAAPGSHTDVDWFDAWRGSPEYAEVHAELDRLKDEGPKEHPIEHNTTEDKAAYAQFAAPFSQQMWHVQKRVFTQYWRTPSYIYSKTLLCLSSALFIGFIFYKAPLSQQGLQNQMLAIFMLFTCFGQLVQQIMPHFVTQRALYEVRERPSKTYSWQAFMLSNIIVELPWQTVMSVIMFFSFYYPVGFYRNAEPAGQVHERGALFFLLIWIFLIFTSTFTHMIIAAVETAEEGGNIANLLFSLTLVFCGVLATPQQFPGFWIFMYRVSPFNYLVDSFISVGVANTKVVCADNEYLHFDAPSGQSCGQYMQPYIDSFGGYLEETNASGTCSFCTIEDTNAFLSSINSSYSHRWRNFGIMWGYVIFNVAAALLLYWLVRVPKGPRKEDKDSKGKTAKKTGKFGLGMFSKAKA
jgi:ATP-binding cassette subfamily G (WHITE) protein 2 (PDR)